MKRKDTRPLTVLGTSWEYKIGRKHIAIYGSEGDRYFPLIYDMVGEANFNNKTYQLNPAMIFEYIKTVIIGSKAMNKCSSCNKFKPDVTLRVNPLNAKIYQNYGKHYLCNSCEADIADEI